MTDFRPVGILEHRARLAREDREEDFQKRIIDLAQRAGWLVYHTHDSRRSQKGFPDLVLVHATRGLVLFRELKTEKGTLRPEQRTWIHDLTEAGQDAAVWRPRQWFDQTIPDLLTGRTAAPAFDDRTQP
ncbi:VRR-NUC domain-containing protein [Clavibacter michiganensis subsp. michiganensis]|uniref:VRR-NUC domain-containing protein n=1 Tax=Clavibacter michiganensis TaxID=28447 RepID=UPI001C653ECB|nr:VRR-NUC domain-containing protein [Clavibacter michiganensis]MBW8025317.1 VRR-NUC domain-containing protein [Clavibacter michiganensis subsp. michiganensis]